MDSRFNVQIYQMLPFVGWNQTEFELMLAIRNLFYEDLDAAALLDEIAVIDSPRRLLGGVFCAILDDETGKKSHPLSGWLFLSSF